MKKKGLSTIVTAVMIMLIVLVAVVLVYNTLIPIIKTDSSKIQTETLTTDLNIKKATVIVPRVTTEGFEGLEGLVQSMSESDGVLEIQVERNTGAGNIAALIFNLKNNEGKICQVKRETNIKELETKTFEINLDEECENLGEIKSVSIAAVIDVNGEEATSGIKDTEKNIATEELTTGDYSSISRSRGYIGVNYSGENLVITKVEYNLIPGYNRSYTRELRSFSDIEPSGLGVHNITVYFSGYANVSSNDILIYKVRFKNGNETIGERIYPEQSTYRGYSINIMFPKGEVIDTWVKIILKDNIKDNYGNKLDGEPNLGGSNRGYLYDLSDLPTGDGIAGGDAIFYVGSLRGDMRGAGFIGFKPDGKVDVWDINGFTSAYTHGNLDADMRGAGFTGNKTDGKVDVWDINGFTSIYSNAIRNNLSLGDLPEPVNTCTDSDGGLNYGVKGTATSTANGDYTDHCATTNSQGYFNETGVISGEWLREFYCLENGYAENVKYPMPDGSISGFVPCPNGCVDGACVTAPANQTCTDSDGGNNYYTKGTINWITVLGYADSMTDQCINNQTLAEYSCSDFYATGYYYHYTEFTCPNGCYDGACITIPSNQTTYKDRCPELNQNMKNNLVIYSKNISIQQKAIFNYLEINTRVIKEDDYLVVYNPNIADKTMILEVSDISVIGGGRKDDYIVFTNVLCNSSCDYRVTGNFSAGAIKMFIAGWPYWVKAAPSQIYAVTWGDGASDGNAGYEKDTFRCDGVVDNTPPLVYLVFNKTTSKITVSAWEYDTFVDSINLRYKGPGQNNSEYNPWMFWYNSTRVCDREQHCEGVYYSITPIEGNGLYQFRATAYNRDILGYAYLNVTL